MPLKRLTLSKVKERVKKRGFKVLSKKYYTAILPLTFRCNKGHIFNSRYNSIQQGRGCPYCSHRVKLNINICKKIAQKRNFILLSKTYKRNDVLMKYCCSRGHIWMASHANIANGKGCPHCYKLSGFIIEDMKILAKKYGFFCLSKKYYNMYTKLKWKCKNGHVWDGRPSHIKQGTGCPYCTTWKCEEICRKYFEYYLNSKFPKKRPKWLRNGKGYNLELDGYNEKLGIAFEYQGEQHYIKSKIFKLHSLKKIKHHDLIKQQTCKKKKIKLLQIPYTISTEKVGDYILSWLNKENLYK
jgi:hypothetical protein